jgi:hypothetical protein
MTVKTIVNKMATGRFVEITNKEISEIKILKSLFLVLPKVIFLTQFTLFKLSKIFTLVRARTSSFLPHVRWNTSLLYCSSMFAAIRARCTGRKIADQRDLLACIFSFIMVSSYKLSLTNV